MSDLDMKIYSVNQAIKMEDVAYSKGYQQGRADAIDELAKALIEQIQYEPHYCLGSKEIEKIAEELKENY